MRDRDLAGIGTGAPGDIRDGFSAFESKPRFLKLGKKRAKRRFGHPMQKNILRNRRPHAASTESARNFRQFPHLVGIDVSERASNIDAVIAFLFLLESIGFLPIFKSR